MGRSREIACKNYICEGNCSKGREGTFRKRCQTCNLYFPIKGGRPSRKDNRRQKNERKNRKEMVKLVKQY